MVKRNTELFRKEFRAWLAHNADYVVGQACESARCPISTHLVDRTGRRWNVSRRECVSYRDDAVCNDFNTPRWARDFIRQLDLMFPRARDVLGREALQILDEAVK